MGDSIGAEGAGRCQRGGPENGVTLWGLGSRWNAERDQAADFFSSKKGTERDPLLIRWDL